MTHSENAGDTLILSNEHSPLSNELCCSGSPTLCERPTMKKGPWTSAEDALLIKYVKEHGEGNWNAVQIESGLFRCGKSCRLRWANHLRPHLKKGSFSQEEEQLIAKLHFEMGNKWAHMATRLPGRTDNEIKNYWNTRVKRRQRAGLPLYPDDIRVPESDENKLVRNTSELNSADKQNSAVSLEHMPEMLDFKFDYCKNNPCPLPYATALVPDIPDINIPAYGLGSYMQNSGRGHVKQSGVPEISFPDCLINLPNFTYDPIYLNPGLICPCDVDPGNKKLASFSCSIPGNTVLSNNNSSSRPLPEALKMELPSLQYIETEYNDWNTSSSFTYSYDDDDSYIQSPRGVSLQSDCDSSINNGLLEDLVYESRAVNSGKKRFFEEISGDAFTPGIIDPNSPFCPKAASLFNVRNANIGNQFDEFSSFGTPLGLGETMLNTSEISTPFGPFEDTEDIPDLSRPDALLESLCFLGNCGRRRCDITEESPIVSPKSSP